MVDSLVDHRAYKPYTLVGPLVWRPVLAPLAVNASTTNYTSPKPLFASFSTLPVFSVISAISHDPV